MIELTKKNNNITQLITPKDKKKNQFLCEWINKNTVLKNN